MSMETISLNKGSGISTTGGTATAFNILSRSGSTVDLFGDGTNVLDRTSLTFNVKVPKVASGTPNGYTQARKSMVIKIPKTLANGNVTVNTIRVELSSDVETSSTEHDVLRAYAAESLAALTALDAFWHDGSVE